ncbi:MAG: hypothetical protein JJU28_20065 [Cyclobacteriaceae bacterium]|nr:hypothetical protein [Cyclobacteriaceae bacterium]
MNSRIKNISGTFLSIILAILLTNVDLYAQTFTSQSPGPAGGDWFSNDTWIGNNSPGNLTDDSNTNKIITIAQGNEVFTNPDQSLIISGQRITLQVNGILVIRGDFTMSNLGAGFGDGNRNYINISSTGVLIIEKNASFLRNTDITNNGRFVIGGSSITTSGTIFNRNNTDALYTTTTNFSTTNGTAAAKKIIEVLNEPDVSPLPSLVDLFIKYNIFLNIILPIDLLSFTAEATEQDVVLKWSTASETNNDFFTLEKTRDGKEFEVVAYIDGAGNSKDVLEYTFTDTRPFAGTSYYRLTQTDFDGTSETFPMISVVFNSDLFSQLNIASVYPNAFQEAFVLQYTSPENNPVELNMINLKGEVIYRQNFSSQKGFNELRFTEGSLLQNDVYMIYLVQGGAVTQTHRVLKR